MTEAAAPDLFQYPPGDFRWRLWLLCERIDKVFTAGRAAGMERVSLRDPRHKWALMELETDALLRFGITISYCGGVFLCTCAPFQCFHSPYGAI
jgi:hypothetical protein